MTSAQPLSQRHFYTVAEEARKEMFTLGDLHDTVSETTPAHALEMLNRLSSVFWSFYKDLYQWQWN